MTIEEIRNLDIAGVEARVAEIRNEMNADGADLPALTAEVDALEARRNDLRAAAEQRRALAQRVAAGQEGTVVRNLSNLGAPQEQRTYNAASPEYRTAFFRELMGQELNAEERAAYTHMTTNTVAVLPATTLDRIWDLVSTQHSIMGDVTIYRTGTVIEVITHTDIVQGKAKTVAENTANDDEKNTFIKVTLSGKDFSKHIDISYALDRMSVDAFEDYIVNEIGHELGRALAEDVVTNAITAKIAAANKVTSAAVGKVTYKELAAAFGLLKRANNVCIYATRKTIFTHLVGMVDTAERPIFQPTAQVGAMGVLLGATVKVEDAVADGVLLIGDASKVTYNMVQDIMVESDKDIKKHVITYAGYARGEGALIDDVAFAEMTVKTA